MPNRQDPGFQRTRRQLSRSLASCFEYCTGDFLSKDRTWRVTGSPPPLSRKESSGRNSAASGLDEKQTRVPLDLCIVKRYIESVIRSFAHKGLEKFFRTGSKAGIQAQHAARLRIQLGMLDDIGAPEDMNAPGWRLHPLKGDLAGHWSITVNGNWRLTFRFEGEDAILVDYQDYH